MDKINFVNGSQPAINDTNLNQLQVNVENEINAINDIIISTVLYENEEGTSEDIILNDNVTNYKYIEIFYCRNSASLGQIFSSTKIYEPNEKQIDLGMNHSASSGATIQIYSTRIAVSGNTITFKEAAYIGITETFQMLNFGTDKLNITRVIGYK